MVGRVGKLVVLSLSACFLLCEGTARAGVEPSPFSIAVGSQFDSARFWVHFDPQPSPPGRLMDLDASDPVAPTFVVRSGSAGKFRLEFAFQSPTLRVSSFRSVTTPTGFQLSALGFAGPLFTASFSFLHAGAALALGSDVAFDPQVAAPGLPGVLVTFSLLAGPFGGALPEGIEVEMALRISDPGDNALRLLPFSVPFVRGDANADGTPDLSDAVTVLGFLFLGTPMNDCGDAADFNDDGEVDISDPLRLLGHLFLGSARPPDPFVGCGRDRTEDGLDCKGYGACF